MDSGAPNSASEVCWSHSRGAQFQQLAPRSEIKKTAKRSD